MLAAFGSSTGAGSEGDPAVQRLDPALWVELAGVVAGLGDEVPTKLYQLVRLAGKTPREWFAVLHSNVQHFLAD